MNKRDQALIVELIERQASQLSDLESSATQHYKSFLSYIEKVQDLRADMKLSGRLLETLRRDNDDEK